MAKNAITKENLDQIVFRVFVLGQDRKLVSQSMGFGLSTVTAAAKAFELMRKGEMEQLARTVHTDPGHYSEKMITQVASMLGIEVPECVADALRDLRKKREVKRQATKAEKLILQTQVVEEPTPAQPVKEAPEAKNETLYFCRILEELARQNELMEQLMDVVIPKYIADLKDNLNVNFDTVTQSLKRAEDTLEGIKINTRKRGL